MIPLSPSRFSPTLVSSRASSLTLLSASFLAIGSPRRYRSPETASRTRSSSPTTATTPSTCGGGSSMYIRSRGMPLRRDTSSLRRCCGTVSVRSLPPLTRPSPPSLARRSRRFLLDLPESALSDASLSPCSSRPHAQPLVARPRRRCHRRRPPPHTPPRAALLPPPHARHETVPRSCTGTFVDTGDGRVRCRRARQAQAQPRRAAPPPRTVLLPFLARALSLSSAPRPLTRSRSLTRRPGRVHLPLRRPPFQVGDRARRRRARAPGT